MHKQPTQQTHRNDEEMTWKVLSSEQIIDRPWLSVSRKRVQLPNGHINPEYYVLHYPDWINVLPRPLMA